MTTATPTVYQPRDGRLALALSNMVVQVFRAHTGRGPAKARAHLNEDLVSIVVQDTLTPLESTLVATGNTGIVLSARRALHEAMRADLVAGIEALTGRTVIALFSDNSVDPDIALESFLLAPQAVTA